jgi:Na+-transporting NADH:ubiquinone oxidoreductase subunit A
MGVHRITKGLDLPIAGEPRQQISEARPVTRVAIMADDYVGMRPRMHVVAGDTVKRGQILFEDKKIPGVQFTAPGAGKVIAVNRGERRALQSVVIELNEREQQGQTTDEDLVAFASHIDKPVEEYTRDEIKALLLESGVWSVLRARPFGRTADPETAPHSVFVTAMDTNPLAASPEPIIAARENDFKTGLAAVTKLTEGTTYVCKAAGASIPAGDRANVQVEEFAGVHPAGTVGVHIHTLDPACRGKNVWYLNYQDVLAIGRLLQTGQMDIERVVALGGPTVNEPRLLKTRLGASIDELLEGELSETDNRVVSGSVFSGRKSMGKIHGYLGRYHLQISALEEGRKRQFLSWLRLGLDKFSIIPANLSSFLKPEKLPFTTATNGGPRAIVPIGMYEHVMPMDIPATFLLKSLCSGDVELAEKLGVLELEEEDLSLCTFVCPGKIEYGPILRENLDLIEREG